MKKICTACFEPKDQSQFYAGRTVCTACLIASSFNYKQDRADRERHQHQVQLNRLINSLPRITA